MGLSELKWLSATFWPAKQLADDIKLAAAANSLRISEDHRSPELFFLPCLDFEGIEQKGAEHTETFQRG